jgi:hypothetical protein
MMGYSIYITDIPMSKGIGQRNTDEPTTWDEYIAYENNGLTLPEDEDPFLVISLPEAPLFPGDPTERTNSRSPSYTMWAEFCDDVGLQPLFFDKQHGLMREHPGWFQFGPEHLLIVRRAREAYEKQHPGLVPGWAEDDYWSRRRRGQMEPNPGDEQYTTEGGHLARLLWLEWWMDYALKHFDHPGIANH